MTAAEFRVLREQLGLADYEVARLLDVQDRAVVRWEEGSPIPVPFGEWLRALSAKTAGLVEREVARLQQDPTPCIGTYAGDEAFRRDHPDSPFTATWHRAWVGRVARRVPGIQVEYKD